MVNTAEQPTGTGSTNAYSSAPSSSGTGIIGSIVGAANSAIMQWAQYFMNLTQARQQYDYEMKAWNKTNEYNSPTAQMERLKAAGLNPNLVAGNSTSTGNSGPAPSQKAVVPNFLGMQNDALELGQYLQQSALNQQNLINLRKQNELTEAEIQKKNAEKNFISTQDLYKQFEYNNILPLSPSKVQYEINDLIQRIEYRKLMNTYQGIQNDMTTFQRDFVQPREYEFLGERLQNARYQRNFLMPSQVRFYNASALNQKASAANTAATTKYILPLSSAIKAQELTGKELDNMYLSTFGTQQPANIKFLGIPVGAATIGFDRLGRSIFRGVKDWNRNAFGSMDYYLDE